MICPNSAKPGLKPLSQLQHPREVIRQFTPNWFAATMGTGVLALALRQAVPGLSGMAEALWLLTTIFQYEVHRASRSAGRHRPRPRLADSQLTGGRLSRSLMVVVVLLRKGRQAECRKSTSGQ